MFSNRQLDGNATLSPDERFVPECLPREAERALGKGHRRAAADVARAVHRASAEAGTRQPARGKERTAINRKIRPNGICLNCQGGGVGWGCELSGADKTTWGFSELSAISDGRGFSTFTFSLNVAHWHGDDFRTGSGSDEGTAVQLPALFRGRDDARRLAGGRDVGRYLRNVGTRVCSYGGRSPDDTVSPAAKITLVARGHGGIFRSRSKRFAALGNWRAQTERRGAAIDLADGFAGTRAGQAQNRF